jgi:predicted phage-related endonuclease
MKGCEVFRVDTPNERFIRILAEKEEEFWDEVKRQVPPPSDGGQSTGKILKELYPKDSGTRIALPSIAIGWHQELMRVKEQIGSLEARKSTQEQLSKAELKDATQGTLPNDFAYTFKPTLRKAHLVEPSTYGMLKNVSKEKAPFK